MGDDEKPLPMTRAQARAAGLTDSQIDMRLATGRFTVLGRGVFGVPTHEFGADGALLAGRRANQVPTTDPPGHPSGRKPPGTLAIAKTSDRSILIPPELGAALLAHPGRELVLSHLSAARVLGLPKPLGGWKGPELTASSGSARRRAGIHIRVAPLSDSEVAVVQGIPITSVARTVLDCLRTVPARDALAILDAALHRAMVTPSELIETMVSQLGWPGVARGREVLLLGNGRRESPLESWTAWGFHIVGVPTPDWQVDIRSQSGRFLGRADCWWLGVVGEADGRSKYALAAAERGRGAKGLFDVLQDERDRERQMRDAGAEVVRWSTGEVLDPRRLRNLGLRIRQALHEARASSRFTGTATPAVLPFARVQWPIQGAQQW